MNEISIKIEKLREKFIAGYSNVPEIDEGWYQIVLDCDAELTALDPGYRVAQIKEKFGGLRYYFTPSDDIDKMTHEKMREVVQRHEGIAWRTCEATGKPGVLMKSIGGWYKTLNPEYAGETLHYARYKPAKDFKQEALEGRQSLDP